MHRVSGAWKFAILSDAIHMTREHRQNAIQYLYIYIFQISNVQKVRHLEQPADGWRTEQSRCVVQCK